MFCLEITDRAYSINIPDRAWGRASRHRTLNAAISAYQEEKREMRRICGPNAYNQHVRIVETTRTGRRVLSNDEIDRAIEDKLCDDGLREARRHYYHGRR